MKARYLLLTLAFASFAAADDARLFQFHNADLKMILQEARAALATSTAPQDVPANLKDRTYGKQVTLTEASVTDLSEFEGLPVGQARHFAGLYTLDGRNFPEPSSLDTREIAKTMRGLMTSATWRADPDRIRCSGAGLVVLNVKKDQMSFTYNLLASTYTFRRLRLGQLVSVEATISGVSVKDGDVDVFGIIKQVQAP